MNFVENSEQRPQHDLAQQFEKLAGILMKTSVGNNLPSEDEDVKNTRSKLNTLGYEAGDEDFGMIDSKLDQSIRKFQKDNGLKQDGLIHPFGETDTKLTQKLIEKNPALSEKRTMEWKIEDNPPDEPFYPEELEKIKDKEALERIKERMKAASNLLGLRFGGIKGFVGKGKLLDKILNNDKEDNTIKAEDVI